MIGVDVLLRNLSRFITKNFVRKNNTIETSVYRKKTHNDIYLHWESFTPEAWKLGTLKTLLFRAHTICSNNNLSDEEVKHLKHVFITIDGFPPWAVLYVISRVEKADSTTQINQSIINPEPSNVKQHKVILPYKGEHTLANVKRHIAKLLPEQEEVVLVFTGTKLGTKFNIKDKTSKEHQHDLTYSVICPDLNCNEGYNGEIGRRLIERVYEHSGKDVNSRVFKHSIETNQQ